MMSSAIKVVHKVTAFLLAFTKEAEISIKAYLQCKGFSFDHFYEIFADKIAMKITNLQNMGQQVVI